MTTMTRLDELTGQYVVDAERSKIGFIGRHSMATRVHGHFGEFQGTAYLDGDEPSKSSARLTIVAKSLQTHDRRRDEHLRGKFLDTATHPVITFVSTKVEQTAQVTFTISGDLTIRGVTKPVTMDLELVGTEHDASGDLRVRFTGTVTIDRRDWGVNWNAATALFISEKVVLQFDVATIRRP
ncbi:YceI family protein [[Actinomadura] parvosata]|uniref:YceI family protein n=1 Tax=[Actinomadura] parvosata TaxID=1955412 RepID=UPI00406C236E